MAAPYNNSYGVCMAGEGGRSLYLYPPHMWPIIIVQLPPRVDPLAHRVARNDPQPQLLTALVLLSLPSLHLLLPAHLV